MTSNCRTPTAPRTGSRSMRSAIVEDLDGAFLGELVEALLELLPLRGVEHDDAVEELGGEARDALELDARSLGERVADAEVARVPEAEDVAGPGLLDERPLLREELERLRELQRPARARIQDLHAARELPGHDAQERDAVAVRGIHVRLDLEDEARERRGRAGRPFPSSSCGGAARAPARESASGTARRRSRCSR